MSNAVARSCLLPSPANQHDAYVQWLMYWIILAGMTMAEGLLATIIPRSAL